MKRSKNLENFDKMIFNVQKKIGDDICKDLDIQISLAHISLLWFIRNNGTCIVSDIAQHLNITLSGVTSAINKLVNIQLVTRKRSESDRRHVVIALTEKGEKFLERVDENRVKLIHKCFKGLRDEEIKEFFKILNKITENVFDGDINIPVLDT